MKVYVVECGKYSTCHGVFSSRELAEANLALHDNRGSITEYELDVAKS